jgi:hypothetical protein
MRDSAPVSFPYLRPGHIEPRWTDVAYVYEED